MDFLKIIDDIYANERAHINESDDTFCCFIEIDPIDQNTTLKFLIKKREKAMLLIVDGKQRVHMSDLQIINCICNMCETDRDWFLCQFIRLLNCNSKLQ